MRCVFGDNGGGGVLVMVMVMVVGKGTVGEGKVR